jgi:hypothetical protein
MKDQELKLEEIEASLTLGGAKTPQRPWNVAAASSSLSAFNWRANMFHTL